MQAHHHGCLADVRVAADPRAQPQLGFRLSPPQLHQTHDVRVRRHGRGSGRLAQTILHGHERPEVPSVGGKDQDSLESVPGEGRHVVQHDRFEGLAPKGYRSGVGHVVVGATDPDGGSDKSSSQAPGDAKGEVRSDLGVGEQRQVRSVLLHGTAGEENRRPSGLDSRVDFWRTESLQRELVHQTPRSMLSML